MPRASTVNKTRAPLWAPCQPQGKRGLWFTFSVYAFAGGLLDATADVADYAFVLSFRRIYEDKDGYLYGLRWDSAKKKAVRVYLHRAITRAPDGVLVDHRYGRRRDVRRSMLRFATHSQNSANRRRDLRRKLSSRYLGVTLHKQTGKWQAALKHQDKCCYLGLYANEEDAARARDAAAKKVWGRFAVLNRYRRPAA